MAKRMGPPTVYAPKSGKRRYQGNTTEAGGAKFERARKRLGDLTGIKRISDGDVFEYLASVRELGAERAEADLVK
jgi:hypothetical protein